ncbi:hypothetical protein [Geothrix sp. SG200]|uniref:hypothetical protein n=1 Tax=Geothrix sp. SG200 TaxID=2922865 RepID=UPI001FADE5B3|nr:hypothetical protein [Geothrix sp. SG200]
MARSPESKVPTAPTNNSDFVTVPRSALQALAEWAYPVIGADRVWAKLPPKHPRWTSWNIDDDLFEQLLRERMAFLKGIFWKAEQEAARRERAMDPIRDLGHCPSLETFMECVAEMDDPNWDKPLAPKEVTKRKKEIRAKRAEEARVKNAFEHPTPEKIVGTMTLLADTSVSVIKKNLASDDPEIQAKAQEEIPRLVAELGKLATAS